MSFRLILGSCVIPSLAPITRSAWTTASVSWMMRMGRISGKPMAAGFRWPSRRRSGETARRACVAGRVPRRSLPPEPASSPRSPASRNPDGPLTRKAAGGATDPAIFCHLDLSVLQRGGRSFLNLSTGIPWRYGAEHEHHEKIWNIPLPHSFPCRRGPGL